MTQYRRVTEDGRRRALFAIVPDKMGQIGTACPTGRETAGANVEQTDEQRGTVEHAWLERETSCFGDSAPVFKFKSGVLPAVGRKKAVARSQIVWEVHCLSGGGGEGEAK